jgi:hypothetical protein
MKRILVVVGLVVSLGTVLGTLPAGAGPSNDVTFVLSCDRGVTATVAASFVDNAGGDVSNFTCDSRRVVIPVPNPETAIVVTQFDISTQADGCASATPVTLPARLDCGPKAGGAKLTVR